MSDATAERQTPKPGNQSAANVTSRSLVFLALSVFSIALLLRVINLDSDPSALLGRDFITDEGWWAHNARNAFFYGQARIDEYNLGLYSAYLYNLLLTFTVKLFGVSFLSIRLLPAISGWLTVIVLFILTRRELSLKAAVFASVLLGFSNLHIVYSRIGFAESTVAMFLALSLWLWSLRRVHSGFALLAGFCFALMVAIKITSVYFAPGLILLIAVEAIRRKTTARDAVCFLAGSAFVGGAFAILFVLPSFHDWLSFNVANGSGSEWSTDSLPVVSSTLKLLGSSFFAKEPIVTALSLLALCLLIISATKNGLKKAIRDAGELELTSAALLLGYLFTLALTLYQPERRFVPALLLMIILSTAMLERGWVSLREIGAGSRIGTAGWFAVLFFLPAIGVLEIKSTLRAELLWPCKILVIASLLALTVLIARNRIPERATASLLAASKVLFISMFLLLSLSLIYKSIVLWGVDAKILRSAPFVQQMKIIVVVAILAAACARLTYGIVKDRPRRTLWLMGAVLLIEAAQISTWLLQPTYSLREANAALAATLSSEDTVVTYYETALISSPAKVICRSTRRGFNVDAFEKFNPQYILVLRRDNWKDYSLPEMPVEEWPPPKRFVPERVEQFDLCPTRLEGPRFIAELYSLRSRPRRHGKSSQDGSSGQTR